MHSQLKLFLAVAVTMFGYALILTDTVEAQTTAPANTSLLCNKTEANITTWDKCDSTKTTNTLYKSCSTCYYNTATGRYIYRYDAYKCISCGAGGNLCLMPVNCTGTGTYVVNNGTEQCNTFNSQTKMCSNAPCSSTMNTTMQAYPDPTSACVQ